MHPDTRKLKMLLGRLINRFPSASVSGVILNIKGTKERDYRVISVIAGPEFNVRETWNNVNRRYEVNITVK